MSWYLWLYLAALLISFILNLGLAGFALGRHSTRLDVIFGFLSIGASLTSLCFLILSLSPDPEAAYFWTRLRFIPLNATTMLLFLFALEKLGYHWWVSPRRSWIFAVIPVFINGVIWSDRVQDWFLASVTYQRVGIVLLEDVRYTGLYYFPYVTYWYLIMCIAFVLMIRPLFVYRARHRAQVGLILGAILIPGLFSLQRTLNMSADVPNLFPIGICISTMLFAVAQFRYRLLGLSPSGHTSVFTNMPDAALVLDTQLRVVDVNQAGETLLNRPYRALRGVRITEAYPGLAQHLAELSGSDRVLQRADVPFGTARDGTARYVELDFSPLHEGNNVVTGHLLALRDVTARRTAQIEREQRVELLDSYARTVAHDLKQPLTVIRFAAETLTASRPADTADNRELLDLILQAADATSNIIDSILMLARAHDDAELLVVPIAMDGLVRSTLDMFRAEFKTVQAQWCIEGTLPSASGHADWVRRVWANYIGNALKYGGDPPSVIIGGEQLASNQVRYWVRDNGAGLSPEQQARLFTDFTRLEQHQGIAGTGLGLSIARVVVQKMGGSVGVESTPGQGSTFYFTLPAVRMEDAAADLPRTEAGRRVVVSAENSAVLARG